MLTRKGIKFQWTSEANAAFQLLVKAFTSAPVLMHFNLKKPIIVETNASDYVSAHILSQHDDDGIFHLVAFHSKKPFPTKCNYEVYNKELLASIRCFGEWREHL